MSKKLIVNKGYRLEVTSWENDGDDYRTLNMTFDTKEEALAVVKMAKVVWKSSNNGGIGNLMEDEDSEGERIICDYLAENPELLAINNQTTPDMLKDKIIEFYKEPEFMGDTAPTEDNWKEYIYDYLSDNQDLVEEWAEGIMHYNSELMGYSEYYYSRIYESYALFYSPEDVYLEEIK